MARSKSGRRRRRTQIRHRQKRREKRKKALLKAQLMGASEDATGTADTTQ